MFYIEIGIKTLISFDLGFRFTKQFTLHYQQWISVLTCVKETWTSRVEYIIYIFYSNFIKEVKIGTEHMIDSCLSIII